MFSWICSKGFSGCSPTPVLVRLLFRVHSKTCSDVDVKLFLILTILTLNENKENVH